ncbi:shikimate dehydrogenase [Candidatus Woesearchaeota archaeon]|nr:shikimate dehydrogenase [Candidatus Woesearchaeota archaeon]
MLAAVITAKNYERVLNDIDKAKNANLIELRLDYLKRINFDELKKIIKKCKKPIVITNRKKDEGGFFNGNEKERIEVLKNAIKLNSDYIDIEYSSNKGAIKNIIEKKKNTKIIISYHNFKETPRNIKDIYDNIKKLNPNLIKIVTNANSTIDNFKIFDLIKTANKEGNKIIAFCMNSYGEFSRILSVILGSKITYASIEKGAESASAQLTLDELSNIYRIKKLNKNTKIFGLIGNPVEHSWSHIIHNTAFDKLNINAVYLKFRVDKLKEFIEYFKKLNIGGFSVTIPHKIDVMKYLDEIDKKAKEISAVNTIVVRNKKFVGYNTDCDGAIMALKEKIKLNGKNTVVLGAGGSTRALVYSLKEEEANITILNRTVKKAKVLADYFNCGYGRLNDLNKIDYDILINTTPIGMHPDINNSLVPINLIKKNAVVFDIVFNPYKTKLLQDAEKKGCTVIPGIDMLINGAILQFKLWTNKSISKQFMKTLLLNYLKNASHQN